MRMRSIAGLMFCGLTFCPGIRAQSPDPNVAREVSELRMAMVRSNEALRQYTWTERTEILVGGNLKSAQELLCRYNGTGELTKTPIGENKAPDAGSAISNRPIRRSRADKQDYVRRAISMVQTYVPPKPEDLQYALQRGDAFLSLPEAGKSEIRFPHYYQQADSFIFTYDTATKRLLRVSVSTYLGNPKDPVTMDALFETLPDGVNHLASITLTAKAKKLEIKRQNLDYRKIGH